jgi:hypothetical protein
MHAAWPTATGAAFTVWHPDPGRLRRALRRDLGEAMVYPLLPLDWPRNTPRLAFALEDPADIQLGIAPAPGSDPGRLVPISSLTVRRGADGLAAVSGDGRSWPLAGIFGRLLSELAVEAFKVTTDGPHTPRITIDRLVAVRESWRTSAAGCPLGTARGEREEYLAARRWKAELGLPDHVFVKAATETKPVFADLTSPACVSMVASILRACRRAAGDTAAVTVSEMLPAPEQAWLPDADGQRYLSELRLQIRDDAMAAGACASSRESVTR